MAVYRVQRTRDYTVMSNYHLKDKGLTLKSKGLLSMILSLPEEWNYTIIFVGSLLGALLGHKMLKKHFERAGIV